MKDTIIMPFKTTMRLYKEGRVKFENQWYEFEKEDEGELVRQKANLYSHRVYRSNKWFITDKDGAAYMAIVDEVGEQELNLSVVETDHIFNLIK